MKNLWVRGRTATSMVFLSTLKKAAGRQNAGNDGSGLRKRVAAKPLP
jgi:hypothetical protein